MSKTEISAKILKSWKNISFYYHNTQKVNQHTSRVGYSFEPNMKQIHKAVQALESDIGFWRPSWILLKKLKKRQKKITGQIP